MAGLANYNGWSGVVRQKRMPAYHKAEELGLFPPKSECLICGQHNTGGIVDYHSEEYGPLPADYWANIVALCYRCHGMLHIRHQMPNRWAWWRDYVTRVQRGEVERLIPYPTFRQYWTRVMKWGWKDVEATEGLPEITATGIPYLDAIGEPIREVTKEAMVNVRWEGDPKQGAIMPDPKCYPDIDWKGWIIEPIGGWPKSTGPVLPIKMRGKK